MKDSKKIALIDLEKVIKEKNPRLFKLLPRIILRYLKKIIHQDDLNRLIRETEEAYGHDFVRQALTHFEIKVKSQGLENIPTHGGCIVVCNHPLGGIDGIAVMNEVGKVRTDLKALVNDLLMNLTNLQALLIPTNKHGKNAIENSRRIDENYASDECIIVFPAGLVSRKQNRKTEDLEWQKSIITKAIKYKQPIIPVFIEAANSSFFYNLARYRKKAGIKTNLEMLYLVDEVYKQKGKTLKITVGKEIEYKRFTKEFTPLEWAQKVKEQVYALRSETDKL